MTRAACAARAEFRHQGLLVVRHKLAFLRHCLVLRGYSLREHLLKRLSIPANVFASPTS